MKLYSWKVSYDAYNNINLEVLDLNADTMAAATPQYAMDMGTVNSERGKGNFKTPLDNSDAAHEKVVSQ
ncbi:MAG: hypothetical protein DCC55_00130 [Chloroflexi bacterium]|nr:MAG: hypothetical protein DCC55_00130 [Chloroflexota bacterium]